MPRKLLAKMNLLQEYNLPHVFRLEQACQDTPWNMHEICHAFDLDKLIWFGTFYRGWLCGYLIIESRRHSYRVVRIGVAPGQQRRGLGRQMLGNLLEMADGDGKRVVVDVPETDLVGQLFLKSCGLRCEKILRDRSEYRFGNNILDSPGPFA